MTIRTTGAARAVAGVGDRLLDVRDLHVSFEANGTTMAAVRGATFHVKSGEPVALVGRSGSGKSVTLSAILGLVSGTPGITAGSVRIGRIRLYELSSHENVALRRATREEWERVRGRRVGLVMQDPSASLDPQATLLDHFHAVLKRHHPGWDEAGRQLEAERWLQRVGLEPALELLHRYPDELSGGMCQRAAIALALAPRPDLLLADEPTSALDATVQLEVLDLLARLQREEGVALLLVTHDIGLALRYSERILVMARGRIVDERIPIDFVRAGADFPADTVALLDAARAIHAPWASPGTAPEITPGTDP